jgi:hypothetical protein
MPVNPCPCPLAAVIGDLIDLDCPVKIGQIGKIAFQIKNNPFVDIADNAEWITALAALDSTKVQVTPILHGQESTPAESVTVGGAGSNEVYDGTILNVSDGFYTINFNIRNPSPAVLTALKAYECEVEAGRVGIYMGGSNFVLSNADMSSIPVSSMYVQSSPILNGNTDSNLAQIQFVLKAGWFADGLVTPIAFDFTSLVNG